MKSAKFVLLALLLAVGGNSWADHRTHTHVGVYFGAPWPVWYYPPAYYYPPRVVVVPAAPPPVYIEQSVAPPPPAQTSYWYYCEGVRAYYPYVKECPGGWQAVAPTPTR